MAYKWRPSKTARREFATRMQTDETFAADYYARKEARAEKKRATSAFDYSSAGGNYVPTLAQHDFCVNHPETFVTSEQKRAQSMITYGYSCNEKVHHDFIHVVNELIRAYCVETGGVL